MGIDRITRVNELLRREIGRVMFKILKGMDVDVSAITITFVKTTRDLREARVGVSIRGDESERKVYLDILKSQRSQIQKQINIDLVLKYTPRILFELDLSLAKGNEVLAILAELEEQDNSMRDGENDEKTET